MYTPSRVIGCALAFLVLDIAGCAKPIKGSPPIVASCSLPVQGDRPGPALVGQTYGMQMSALPINSVQFDSEATAKKVSIQALFANRTEGETVSLTARFLNCGDGNGAIRVRTAFLKKDTSPAEPISPWKTVRLSARATALYEEKSVSLDVANYMIEIAAANP